MKTLLLTLHIAGGSFAILSGMIALFLRKGSKLHNRLGTVFFYSMLVMAGSSAYLSIANHEQTNIVVSFLAIYLVTTARKTISNRGTSGTFEKFAIAFGLAIVVLGVFLSIEVINLRGDQLGPIDYFLFFYTFIAMIGGILDVLVVLKGQINGARRIVRHLWRMTFALWIAVGALFLGQPQVFPQVLQENPAILSLPFLVVTFLLLFWLARVWFVSRFKLIKR